MNFTFLFSHNLLAKTIIIEEVDSIASAVEDGGVQGTYGILYFHYIELSLNRFIGTVYLTDEPIFYPTTSTLLAPRCFFTSMRVGILS